MNFTRKRLLCLPAVVALIAGLPLAAIPVRAQEAAKDAVPYSWTFKYAKGDTLRYRQQLEITGKTPDGNDVQLVIKSLYKQAVGDVNPAGDATLTQTTEAQDVTLNGNALPDDPTTHANIHETVSKTGLILKFETENSPPGSEKANALGAMLAQTPTPPQPVKIGDTWKTDVDNRLVEGKKVTMNSTLVGTEKVGGVDTLQVHVTTSIPTTANATDKDTVKADGTYFVDPKTGRLMRAVYTVDNATLPSPAGELQVKIGVKVDLIVPGSDKTETKSDTTQTKGP